MLAHIRAIPVLARIDPLHQLPWQVRLHIRLHIRIIIVNMAMVIKVIDVKTPLFISIITAIKPHGIRQLITQPAILFIAQRGVDEPTHRLTVLPLELSCYGEVCCCWEEIKRPVCTVGGISLHLIQFLTVRD